MIFGVLLQLISTVDPGFWTRFGVHFGLFLGAIRSGASPAQFSKLSSQSAIHFLFQCTNLKLGFTDYWIDKGVIGLNGVIGCFGMTGESPLP
jgi:acyl-CoA oxidase